MLEMMVWMCVGNGVEVMRRREIKIMTRVKKEFEKCLEMGLKVIIFVSKIEFFF